MRPLTGDEPAPGIPSAPRVAWTGVLAFGIVALPFAIALVRLATAPDGHLYLPDDLALIDLHTREALRWRQQLGVFDHNGWNHPGPAYFYFQSVVYRVLGSGARSLFVGATLLNALAAVGCVAVVHRRAGPGRALWAAVWVGVLGVVLAATGPGSTTYSEAGLGALVSPWNPTVVIFPLLLLVLLGAASLARSGLSLLGAVLVGSFVVQTNISCLPVVTAVVVVSAAGWAATLVRDRRSGHPGGASDRRLRAVGWAVAGAVVLVAMWIPPIVQQLTNHPGNLTLIERFFSVSHAGKSLGQALWALVAVVGILVGGTAEVMSSSLGTAPAHAGAALVATVGVVGLAVAVVVVGIRRRARFATALGALGLVGTAAMVVSVDRVVGPLFGYLVVWAVAVPVAVLIAVGMLPWSRPRLASGRPFVSAPGARLALGAVAVVVGVALTVQVARLPALRTVSDPVVGELAAMVTPGLSPGATVFVGDNGFEDARCAPQLLPTEEFIGLVNQLDQRGYRPKVNAFWQAQFGPGYQSNGHEPTQIELSQWTPASPSLPGYRGRIGEIAVTVGATADVLPPSPCPVGG